MKKQDYEQLILFPEDSLASHFPWLESKKVKGTTVTSGRKCSELSEKLSRLGYLVRTYLESCELPGKQFVRTWSVRDTLSPYLILKLRLSERRTEETGSSLWRTPDAHCDRGGIIKGTDANEDVADTDNQGLQGRNSEIVRECASEQFVGEGSTPVANTSCELWEWDRRARDRRSESPNSGWWAVESDVGGVASRLSYWLDGYWRVEPNIPRVATGVKNRVDRLKCLGNAVVPQQVYPILQGIADIEKGEVTK